MEEEKKEETTPEVVEDKVNNNSKGNNKNFITAIIVIGVVLALGIVWKAQTYFKYRSYQKQAIELQKQTEEYSKTYLKQANEAQKLLLEQQKKQPWKNQSEEIPVKKIVTGAKVDILITSKSSQ